MSNWLKIANLFRTTSNAARQKSHVVRLSPKQIERYKARYKAKTEGDLWSATLFSFARKHSLRDGNGEILEDGLIFCRMENNLPKDGSLRTARDLIIKEDGARGARNSLHGSLNHAVGFNGLYSWSDSKYSYMIPLKKIPNLVGGTPVDLFTHGSVRIPPGTVIVRQNKEIPAGRYKVVNAKLIDEFKDLRGVKVIETSQKPHSVSKQIITKLGYEAQEEGMLIGWGDHVDKTFLKFLNKKGLVPAAHCNTPNSKCEQMIEFIFNRAHFDRSWEVVQDGKVIFSYKDEYSRLIPYLEELSKKYNYPLDFDVRKLQTIILESASPKEAANRIRTELKYCSSVPDFLSVDEEAMIKQSKMIVGSANRICRKVDDMAVDMVTGKTDIYLTAPALAEEIKSVKLTEM